MLSSSWMDRGAAWRPRAGTVALLAVLEAAALGSENLLHFPLSIPYLRDLTGGHAYLDLCAFCSGSHVQGELAALGGQGRLLQALLLGSVDLVIPALSCLFGLASLLFLTEKHRGRWVAVVLSLPLLALGLDLAENASILGLLAQPSVAGTAMGDTEMGNTGLAGAVGVLSGLKFLAYGSVLLTLAALGMLRGWAWIREWGRLRHGSHQSTLLR